MLLRLLTAALSLKDTAVGASRSSTSTAPSDRITTCSSTAATTWRSSSRPISKDFYDERLQHHRAATPVGEALSRTRFIVNGAFDPRDGEKALAYIQLH